MRTLILTLTVLLLCNLACSNPSPPSLVDVYEGIWSDPLIPLTLMITHEADDIFAYNLSSGPDSFLTGSLYGSPDHSVSFAYDDGGQRQMVFTGFITGDVLIGEFTHTGLGYDELPVEMVRADG